MTLALVAAQAPAVAARTVGEALDSRDVTTPVTPAPAPIASARADAAAAYGDLPLSFERNAGQTDTSVDFLARGPGYALFLSSAGVVLSGETARRPIAVDGDALVPGGGSAIVDEVAVRVALVGADPATHAAGIDELPGKVNYFIGNDAARWRANVPTYGKVRYAGVYSGVDLVYYGNQRQLEYDFVVAPGVAPSVIRFGVGDDGATRIDANGDLVLSLGSSDVRLRRPKAYQETEARRRNVDVAYRILDGNQIGFSLGAYDPGLPLTIDPVLVYSTYLGGVAEDIGRGITTDGAGNAYVTGRARSTDFPTTAGAFRTKLGEDLCVPPTVVCGDTESGVGDAFVTKLDPSGTTRLFSTYLGGGRFDEGTSIALDASGDVYVAGGTASFDFPIVNGFATTYSRGGDAFVAKLNPTGSGLLYSSYLGSSGHDFASGIGVDASGAAFIVGGADSGFPLKSAAQPTFGGPADTFSGDAFVAKFDTAASGDASLVFSTYLGGTASEEANGVAVDAAGNAYVVGETPVQSPQTFPTTAGSAHPTHLGGSSDAFVAKYSPAGAVVFSTFAGGSTSDFGSGIAVHAPSGTVFITGKTTSPDLATPGVAQGALGGGIDAYAMKLSSDGATELWATYLGGTGDDSGTAIAVDPGSRVFVTGQTSSTNFPTVGATQSALAGTIDAFVTWISSPGTTFAYSSYLGGAGNDSALAVAVDGAENVYLTGSTLSSDFPLVNAIQPTIGSTSVTDAFVTKIRACTETHTSTVVTLCSGTNPRGIAVDRAAQRAYVANYGENTAQEIRLGATPSVSAFVASAVVGDHPFGLAVDEDTHRVYVANQGSNDVTVLDGGKMALLATVPVGQGPVSVAVDERTHRVYVANNAGGGDTISVIDGDPTHTGLVNTVVATLSLVTNGGSLEGLAFDNAGGRLYATVASSRDPTKDALFAWINEDPIGTVALPTTNPIGVAANETTGQAWVSTNAGVIVVDYNGAAPSVAFTVATGAHEEIAVNSTTNRGYAPSGTSLSIVDGVSRSATLRSVGSGADGVAVVPATSTVLVSNYFDHTITILLDQVIVGIASCSLGEISKLLPGAKVELFSGSALVATRVADAKTAAYAIAGLAPGTYTLRYTLGLTVCGAGLVLGAGGAVVSPLPTPIDLANHSWPKAYRLPLSAMPGTLTGSVDEHIFQKDQSDWFVFHADAGSTLILTATGLPANYDLTLYKDIAAAFKSLTSTSDLTRLQAEFAPDAFSPDAFSPDAFSPDAFSPDAFSPDAFSPDAFSPDAFSPDAFSPDAFSPDAFSPDAFSPDAYSPDAFSPDAFSPDAFSPDAFSPDAFSPDAFSPDAYSSAQTRSLYGVSAHNGTASEGIFRHTWDNAGDFYVRLRGRNGAFSLASPFHLTVAILEGKCGSVLPVDDSVTSTTPSTVGAFKTIVVTDLLRTPTTATPGSTDATNEISALKQKLAAYAARPEVAGVTLDVDADARVKAANTQADANNDCPFAKNIVATEIKKIVDKFRGQNPIQNVVLVGNDYVIPFFRYPDEAGLANEENYVPPVLDTTASQAALRLGYVLGQDKYGSSVEISVNDHAFPIPELPVGRLIETAADISGVLDAYLSTTGGVVSTPESVMCTGYDFLADAANAVCDQLAAGLRANGTTDRLIEAGGLPPTDPSAWTASQLRSLLFGSRHDLVFFGGHFSANTALAADYTTRLFSSEIVASTTDFTNTIVFSEGCHSGYNIVDRDAVPGLTLAPDYPQAFAKRRATVIAGTGYQYGDTDFIEYGERLYLGFSQQLRTGTGPVTVGSALMNAKRAYLASTATLTGIHEKTVLESTLYGLPQLAVDLPGARLAATTDTSIVSATAAAASKPGASLGLRTADVTITPALSSHSVPLTLAGTTTQVQPATYLSGTNGVVVNAAQPVLPLELRNVSVAQQVLRGVGFLSGTYADTADVRPLTGAAATELRSVHVPFASDVLYPVRPWRVNYYDAIGGGSTRLALTPAQFVSSGPLSDTGTLRQFGPMTFRLFYNATTAGFTNTTTHPGVTNYPALAASPAISHVAAVPSADGTGVAFTIDVVGDPSAGIQSVWVTYTGVAGTPLYGSWTSLQLAQPRNATGGFDPTHPSTQWTATFALPAGQAASDLRFIVQAANGVGLVTLDSNLGAYFTPGPETVALSAPKRPTSIAFTPPTSGTYRESVQVSATLTSGGTALAGQPITFGLGALRRVAVTDGSGVASVNLSLFQTPASYDLRASFDESAGYLASSASVTFTIAKQGTSLALAPGCGPVVATLSDTSAKPRRLRDQTVFFALTNGSSAQLSAVITDFEGRSPFGPATLAAGTYTLSASYALPFNGTTLTNDRYSGWSASTTIEAGATDIVVSYTGQTVAQLGAALAATATVSTTRSLAGAVACFVLRDTNGNVAAQATSPVADGAASASFAALPAGVYVAEVVVVTPTSAGFATSSPTTALVAVYDPSTFATGGGWVTPGSGFGTLAGKKTSFGFTLKYRPGTTIPDGNLVVKTSGATFNVKASSLAWLVISGGVAEFLGNGTINGAGTNCVHVVATDGGSTDSIQLDVWQGTACGSQLPATPPTYSTSSPLGGGSIVVH